MKKNLKRCMCGSILLVCLLTHSSIYSHHSHANLNRDDVRTYNGIVTRYSWTMPHVFLKVKGPDQQGNVVEYSIEMQHPPAMAKVGWNKKTFKPGDSITWEGSHDYDNNRHYTGLSWAEKSDGTRVTLTAKEEGNVIPSKDFVGLWKRSDYDPATGKEKFNPHYKPPKNWPLSDEGQTLVDNFHEDQNPMVRCGNPGPPKAMIVPYPVMITKPDENTFIFERELMKEVRVIHLNKDTSMGDPSKLGHSIAWFDDGDLVVESTNFIADPWGTHTGIDSSEDKHLIERFSLSDDGLYLYAEITITDPKYLAKPHTFLHRWKKLADREVIQAPCTMESAQLYLQGGKS